MNQGAFFCILVVFYCWTFNFFAILNFHIKYWIFCFMNELSHCQWWLETLCFMNFSSFHKYLSINESVHNLILMGGREKTTRKKKYKISNSNPFCNSKHFQIEWTLNWGGCPTRYIDQNLLIKMTISILYRIKNGSNHSK